MQNKVCGNESRQLIILFYLAFPGSEETVTPHKYHPFSEKWKYLGRELG